MTSGNRALLRRFYESFNAKDGDAMAACYAPEVTFSDPVFTNLRGGEAGGMWRMLTSRSKDLEIQFSQVEADEHTGRAHWEAWYTFSATGRKVHNIIDAEFEFQDGLIIRHVDRFNFYRWSRQALGLPGALLGWTPFVQNKVRRTARRQLDRFLDRSPS